MEYYSTIKKNEIMPFAEWMDSEIVKQSEVSQRRRNIIWHIRESKNKLCECILFTNQKQTHRQKMNLCFPEGKDGGKG